MQPSAQKSTSSASNPDSRRSPVGGGSGPPEANRYFDLLVTDHRAMQRQMRSIVIVVSLFLFILIVVPGETRDLVEALGVKVKEIHGSPGLVSLLLAIIMFRFTGILADSARLGRALNTTTRVSFDVSEKLSLELEKEDGFDETGLFLRSGGVPAITSGWFYWLARVADLMGSYTILLFILGLGFYELYHLIGSIPSGHADRLAQILGGLSRCLFVLSLARVVQYWTIRHSSFVPRRTIVSFNPPPVPWSTSWTTILFAMVVMPAARLMALPWKSKMQNAAKKRKDAEKEYQAMDEYEKIFDRKRNGVHQEASPSIAERIGVFLYNL